MAKKAKKASFDPRVFLARRFAAPWLSGLKFWIFHGIWDVFPQCKMHSLARRVT